MERSRLHQLVVYTLLIIGAVIFSFPFIWMVSSSVKVDREQFSPEFRVTPITPIPSVQSPYIDTHYFTTLPTSDKRTEELLPGLKGLIEKVNAPLPGDVDRATQLEQLARGLIQRLNKRLPSEYFEAEPATFIERSAGIVDQDMVKQVHDEVYRFLGVGAIRVRGKDIAVHELQHDTRPSQRWTFDGTAKTAVADIVDQGKPTAKINYDFSTGNTITLSNTFKLPIDASELTRVQIDLHPDDTWHDLQLVMEHNGRKYVGKREGNLSNFAWTTITWQHASEDDYSTKLRTWTVVEDAGPSDVSGANDLKLTLSFTQASQAKAWANKFKQNYIRTADQMPVWRYVRVSLFLVIAKIALTVLGSSLAAYAFSRITWPGRNLCFMLMLATMMIPPQVTMIPNFLIWVNLGAYNTLSPLWVGAIFGNAFFIFMLVQFMRGIPRDLEDAARIDGCGFLRIYWHVILPLVVPSLAAIAVMTFIGTWNDFMGPLIYIADQRLYPLAFGIYAFSVQIANNPALSMAASVVMTAPIIAIFFFAQRYFIQGITLTGMKG